MKEYDEIPDKCPECGELDLETAADMTVYGSGERLPLEDPPGDVKPTQRAVRCFCMNCGYYLTLSDRLTEEISTKATH